MPDEYCFRQMKVSIQYRRSMVTAIASPRIIGLELLPPVGSQRSRPLQATALSLHGALPLIELA